MAEWQIQRTGSPVLGPYTDDQIVEGLKGGAIPRDSKVRIVGEQSWQVLAAVPAFRGALGLTDLGFEALTVAKKPPLPKLPLAVATALILVCVVIAAVGIARMGAKPDTPEELQFLHQSFPLLRPQSTFYMFDVLLGVSAAALLAMGLVATLIGLRWGASLATVVAWTRAISVPFAAVLPLAAVARAPADTFTRGVKGPIIGIIVADAVVGTGFWLAAWWVQRRFVRPLRPALAPAPVAVADAPPKPSLTSRNVSLVACLAGGALGIAYLLFAVVGSTPAPNVISAASCENLAETAFAVMAKGDSDRTRWLALSLGHKPWCSCDACHLAVWRHDQTTIAAPVTAACQKAIGQPKDRRVEICLTTTVSEPAEWSQCIITEPYREVQQALVGLDAKICPLGK